MGEKAETLIRSEPYLSLFGTIPEFPQKLSTMRKYGISCTIILQALSQIKSMYKDEWEVLLGNCDSMLYLGGNDQTTLDYISKRLGKETIRSVNNSRSYGKQGSHSMSWNKTGRELMTPDELAVMDNKNCILFIRGEYPFFTEKYPYTKHPNYKYTGDASDKYFFDVKDMIQTGQNMKALEIEDSLPAKIFKEAQIADTRESDYNHRHYSRAVEKYSAQGEELLRPKPTYKVFPNMEIPPEQRTREQEEALAASLKDYAYDGTQVPREEALKGYQGEFDEVVHSMKSMYGEPDMNMEMEMESEPHGV